ncbi:MAG: PhoU domain-containing protein [Synechococcus sp. SB0668_bin_15]|nr:PhoU domain-containing protein [Synechococcus sp. SB0668_bin_15]MYC49058.1 PhoU domain-containing protein [Synechococcus sp. SB0662_bin_14]
MRPLRLLRQPFHGDQRTLKLQALRLGSIVDESLCLVLEALSRNDAGAGQRLVALDDLVDQDYATIYGQLTKGRLLESMPREVVVLTALAIRALERLADHGVNVSCRINHGAMDADP